MPTAFCSEQSKLINESIIASAAVHTWVWLVIEVREPWAANPVLTPSISDTARAALQGMVASIPGARLQLIRRPDRTTGPRVGYIAISRLGQTRMAKVAFDTVDEFVSLPISDIVDALLAGKPSLPAPAQPAMDPLLLVCTHGKRDACCAKWGLPCFDAASDTSDIDVWQTSHLGGHRFAPTALSLPSGLCYGRIDPTEVDALLQSIRTHQIWRLDRFRGRTALSREAMTAEHLVRDHTQTLDELLVVVDPADVHSTESHVEAIASVGATRYRVRFTWVDSPHLIPISCGAEPTPSQTLEVHEITAL